MRIPALFWITLAAIAIRLAYMGVEYTPDLSHFQQGDYTLYSIGGHAIADSGDFSNSLFLVRPPLFPIMIDLLRFNDVLVLVVNLVLGGLLVPLCYLLGRQLSLSHRVALVASLIVAIDPTSVVYSTYLGSEPLANFFLVLAMLLLLYAINRDSYWLAFGAGLTLMLSALARPAGYLFWILLSVWLLVVFRSRWRLVSVFAVTCFVGVAAWSVHNGVTFGNPNFSTISVYNLLYYRAASVEHLATGKDIDEVYTELSRQVEGAVGHDTSKVDSGTRQDHYAATAPIQAAMISSALHVFVTYPAAYFLALPLGIARMYGLTTALPTWLWPVDIAWNVAFYITAAIGLILLARRKLWLSFWCVALPVLYFTVGTLAVQTSGMDTRMRSMLTPFLALAAAFALLNIFKRFAVEQET